MKQAIIHASIYIGTIYGLIGTFCAAYTLYCLSRIHRQAIAAINSGRIVSIIDVCNRANRHFIHFHFSIGYFVLGAWAFLLWPVAILVMSFNPKFWNIILIKENSLKS